MLAPSNPKQNSCSDKVRYLFSPFMVRHQNQTHRRRDPSVPCFDAPPWPASSRWPTLRKMPWFVGKLMFNACEIYARQSNCSLSEHSPSPSLLLPLMASASRPCCPLLSLVAPTLSSLGSAAQARVRILCNSSDDFGPYCGYYVCCDGSLHTGSRPPASSGHRTAATLHQRLYSSERFSPVRKRPTYAV